MRVILTHEQADFDALASLLGAALLDTQAVPVLPRRMNRNVRSFVNLYSSELPFTEARDLNGEPIEAITLVDTQSMVTLKGLTENTQVHVVDHHPARPDLDPSWTLVYDRVGAVTTLMVEQLRDHTGQLRLLHASLLLLGIYEDTGSLSYVSTTPRDVRAAAYLLEQGASLRIVSKFLNLPLSDEQRQLYEKLVSSAHTYHIQGQNIVISASEAEELTEEVSTIAHKLRDLLDPDALFLLVGTSEGVRMVARSTTDQIDVSKVTSQFGGGGHERAAAALIRAEGQPVDEIALQRIQERLLALLPGLIRAPITVGHIMSRRPLTLTPETSVQEAAQLMQRYGYEGYPVMRGGKVVGLLTRRAVDRALSHRLNLNAASLMEAGEVTVRPQDALEHLQRLMASTGWGQIPVVDDPSGAVVGIVTRTDLLKTIGMGERATSEQLNLASRLEEALPPSRTAFLKMIAEQAHIHHLPVYIVGGFVRDLILGRPSLDFDIVVEGDAILLARALERQFGGRVVTHNRFGTAKWKVNEVRQHLVEQMPDHHLKQAESLPENLDLISARTEFYERPTALPVVESSNIKLDLHRRDFTMNTLALRLDGRHYGELYDYWGGLSDLRKGLVRVLHSLSFVDDPTRMLRAVRFEQRFGFQIEARTLELVEEARPLLKQVTGDRLRHEFDLIFSEDRATAMLTRLEELGLLSAILSELTWDDSRSGALHAVLQSPLSPEWDLPAVVDNMPIRRLLGYLVWLIPQSLAVSAAISKRLRFPRHLKHGLVSASDLWNRLPELVDQKPSVVVTQLDNTFLPVLYAIHELHANPSVRNLLDRYVIEWRKVQPDATGDTLRAMGIPPSPAYRDILQRLRAAWLDGEIRTIEEENQLLSQLVTKAYDDGTDY